MDRYQVLAYDRRGYQGSRALGAGTLDEHADDLAMVIGERTQRAWVVGHSFGGLVAMVAALRHPGLFRGALCYESPVPWITPRPHSSAPDPNDPAGEVERFFRRVVSAEAWERLSEQERQSRRFDGPALVSDLGELTDRRERVRLGEMTTPVIYAFGDGPAQAYYERLASGLESSGGTYSRRLVPGVGHGIHLSHPQTLADLVGDLMSSDATTTR